MVTVMLVKKFSGMTMRHGFDPLGLIPQVGDMYENPEIHTENGKDYYVLTIQGSRLGFNSENFAILPGLSADEINELEKEAIIK